MAVHKSRRSVLSLKSWLFTPAMKADRFDRAAEVHANAPIIDLEDAIAPPEKQKARTAALQFLGQRRVCVQGGMSFIAFQSAIKDGKISKIVARLSGLVTTPRTDIHYVVTENGVANLRGLSSMERAQALIALAHPAFRDELTAAAKQMHLL
jgi:hypothetical protein